MHLPALRSGRLRARRILTLAEGVRGTTLRWDEGQITLVGEVDSSDLPLPPGAPDLDLPELLVTPGLVDSHTHFGMWALGARRVDLMGVDRLGALERIATAEVEDGWIQGHGWDANHWDTPPDRRMLDALHPAVPVWLDSLDVHAIWLNSAALARLGVDATTADPPGGRIVRDAAGEPTGVLLERAVDMVLPGLPVPDPHRLRRALEAAQRRANALGLTGIHDVGDRHSRAILEQMDSEGALDIRVLSHPPVALLPELLAAGVRSGGGSAMFRQGGVKLFLDGSLGSRTAWMLEPYQGSRDRGLPLATAEETAKVMRAAVAGGIALTVHAIGDAAVRRALELMEPLPRVAIPHRIEHLQCVHPADLHRAGQAGIVASMQPAHLLVDIPLAERHWGARSAGAYAFRSLQQHGTIVAFGSDVPVATADPRDGLFAAMARTGLDGLPDGGWYRGEAMTFESALAAYTLAPSLAAGTSRHRGRLAPWHDADFVAWEIDPLAERGDARAVLTARPRLTVVDGRIVWSDLS
ncbi:MAG: amidohydrolase [Gemmatimonadales bacterium]|nr:amidohydrolase [Gemmatimonadales bacterium]MDZ4389366.1 amidohydrolase [Gemmatimonadales bacterium]